MNPLGEELGYIQKRAFGEIAFQDPNEQTPVDSTLKKVKVNGTIEKVDIEKRRVFGFVSVTEVKGEQVVDLQGDRIAEAEMEEMAYHFVTNSRKAGDMHERIGVGTLIESVAFTKEKQATLGIDLGKVGWYVGIQVTDDATWEAIKSGRYKAFSIGGKALRNEYKGNN